MLTVEIREEEGGSLAGGRISTRASDIRCGIILNAANLCIEFSGPEHGYFFG